MPTPEGRGRCPHLLKGLLKKSLKNPQNFQRRRLKNTLGRKREQSVSYRGKLVESFRPEPYFGCDITLHGKVPFADGKVLSQEFRRRQDPEFSPEESNIFLGIILQRFSYIKTNFMEPAGWRAAVPLPNLAVCSAKNLTSHPDDIILKKVLLLSGENLGWRYLNSCGSYSTVCPLNFPIQGDVTVK